MFHVEHYTWEKGKIFCAEQLFPTKILCGVAPLAQVDCVVESSWENDCVVESSWENVPHGTIGIGRANI